MVEVLGQIGQGEFRLRSGQADGSDEEVIAVLRSHPVKAAPELVSRLRA